MKVRVAVEGRGASVDTLWDWLRCQPELRGCLRTQTTPVPEDAMGVPVEIVVSMITAAGGIGAALIGALSVWLKNQREVTLAVTHPDGRQVRVSAGRIDDVERLLREVIPVSTLTPDASIDG